MADVLTNNPAGRSAGGALAIVGRSPAKAASSPIRFENVRLAQAPVTFDHHGQRWRFFALCPQVAEVSQNG